MGGCRCSFYSCSNSTVNSPNTHFFHFPVKDVARTIRWIKYSNNLEFVNYVASKIKNKVICDQHFKQKSFMNFKKERLIKSAYPTILITKEGPVDLEENPTNYVKENEKVNIPLNFMFLAEKNINIGATKPLTIGIESTANNSNDTSNNLSSIDLSEEHNDPSNYLEEIKPEEKVRKAFTSKPSTPSTQVLVRNLLRRANRSITKPDLSIQKPLLKSAVKSSDKIETSENSEKQIVIRNVESLNQAKSYIFEKRGNDPINKLSFRKNPAMPNISSSTNENPFKKMKLSPKETSIKSSTLSTPAISTDIEIIPFIHVSEHDHMESTEAVTNSNIQQSTSDQTKASSQEPSFTKDSTIFLMQALEESWKQIEDLKTMLKEKINSPPPPRTAQSQEKPKKEPTTNKGQLFNNIKKYLNPSMAALLRIELFGAHEREWKIDEKTLSIELLKLGQNVYDYMRDELRFRLPPPQTVQKWTQEDNYFDDFSDAC